MSPSYSSGALLHKLEQIARGNAHDVAALEVIEGDTRHDESLAAGLDQLAARADAVLARSTRRRGRSWRGPS